MKNKAYSFNNNYIYTNCTGILGSNSRSISFWARTSSSITGDGMAAVSYGGLGCAARFDGYFNYREIGASSNMGCGAITYSTPIAVNSNSWNHYVYALDSNNPTLGGIMIYQNGVLLTNIISNIWYSLNVVNTLPEYPVIIGRSVYPQLFFVGDIDEVRVYNRVLTQAEITYLARN